MINTFTNSDVKDIKPMPMKFLPVDEPDFITKNQAALVSYLKKHKPSVKSNFIQKKPYFNTCLSFSYNGDLQIGLGKNSQLHNQVIAMHSIEMLQGHLSIENWAKQILLKYRNWALSEIMHQQQMNAKEIANFLNGSFKGTNALFTPYAYADWICSRLPTQSHIDIDVIFLERTGQYFARKILPIVDYLKHLSEKRYHELIAYLYSIATNVKFQNELYLDLSMPKKLKIPSLSTIVLIKVIGQQIIANNVKLSDYDYVKLAVLYKWINESNVTLPHHARYIADDIKNLLEKVGINIKYA